jgi:hypothetical protein
MSDNKKLAAMIRKAVKASNAFHLANQALNEYCIDRWGFEPGDRDVDGILDGCMGAAGMASGLSVQEFEQLMEEANA